MKNILTGNDAIAAYEEIAGENTPVSCGLFVSDDCQLKLGYDSGTIVAFDNIDGEYFEESFSTIEEAYDWIKI